jgi:uroporphyrinogen-III synthase
VLACNGAQTEKRLSSLGYSSGYVAENAGNPQEVAKDFSSWLGQRKVLVPHSNLSALSVTKYLKEHQYTTIEVYQTLLKSIEIEPCDLYVFSSPSNIDSFFKMNTPKAGSKIVVWGKASYNSLEQHGYNADFTLRDGTLDELKLLLQNIFKT